MDDIIKVYHEKLGELSYLKGPKAIHCWSGVIEGCEKGFCVILDSPDIETADIDIDFIISIIQNWKSYIEKTWDFIESKLQSQPELFGIGKNEADKYLTESTIPVDLPRFLFYEIYEWAIQYSECAFPIGDPYGICIYFDGEQPIAIEDFSEAEIVDDDE